MVLAIGTYFNSNILTCVCLKVLGLKPETRGIDVAVEEPVL